jgi:hypothetical protein
MSMRIAIAIGLAGILVVAGLPPAVGADARSDEQSPIAALRIEPADGEYLAWADNRLAGPIEVILRAGAGGDVPSDPRLPARASVPAGGSALVARLRPPNGRSGNLQLRMQAVPGSSNARPRDVEYLPPLRGQARIDQGFGGSFSHDDVQNRHALDFAADIGTPSSPRAPAR